MTIATELAAIIMIVVVAAVAATSSAVAQPRQAQAETRRATLTIADATRILLERFPGGEVLEIERDIERGRYVFEADVRDRSGVVYEVVIDAEDGHVIRSVIDDDD